MSESVELVAGTGPTQLPRQAPMAPFSQQALAFLDALSASLLGEPACRAHPGLVALGFWIRPAGLAALRLHASQGSAARGRQAAGVVLHMAPGNVDNLFAYAWIISLLCGNADIIRLSSRPSEEREQLLEVIRGLFEDPTHHAIRARSAIVRYGHDDAVTIELSRLADRRVIWGSDATVAHLRALPAPPLCQDIVFPDRQSAVLLSAAAVVATSNVEPLVDSLYRDAYTYNQRACASPRLLVWLADGAVETARARLWPALAAHISRRNPPLSAADLMDKLVAVQSMALDADIVVETGNDRRLHCIRLEAPADDLLAAHCGGGLFFEGVAETTAAIASWLPPRTQTLTHWGFDSAAVEELSTALKADMPDRLVPIGRALDFGPVWDGMDLFEHLSRRIRVT